MTLESLTPNHSTWCFCVLHLVLFLLYPMRQPLLLHYITTSLSPRIFMTPNALSPITCWHLGVSVQPHSSSREAELWDSYIEESILETSQACQVRGKGQEPILQYHLITQGRQKELRCGVAEREKIFVPGKTDAKPQCQEQSKNWNNCTINDYVG